MALDFAILGDNETFLKYVPIGTEAHYLIMKLAVRLGTDSLIMRIHDYYGDASYSPSEIPLLIREIRTIRESTDDGRLISLLTRLEEICEDALAKGLPILAVAD